MSVGPKRYWCFTLNNYTAEECQAIQDLVDTDNTLQALIVGKEVGENGTPHLQGYIGFKTPVRPKTVLRKLPLRCANVEPSRSSAAIAYCKKDGNLLVEYKTSQQGKRTDLDSLCEEVKKGTPDKDLFEKFPSTYLKYNKHVSAVRGVLQEARGIGRPPVVLWLYGSTGTGKTAYAYGDALARGYPIEEIWQSMGKLDWFDGYNGQKIAILDDFRAEDAKWNFFLRLLDRYPFRVNRKGSTVQWVPSIIYITCPYSPEKLWATTTDEDIEQLKRRITYLYSFSSAGTYSLEYSRPGVVGNELQQLTWNASESAYTSSGSERLRCGTDEMVEECAPLCGP